MTPVFTPERWAFEITHVLNAAFGTDRFPIDIPMVALEYSKQRFPDDPIVGVRGDILPTFDGGAFQGARRPQGLGASSTTKPSPRKGGSTSRSHTAQGA